MHAVPSGERRVAPPLRAAAGLCPACGQGDLFDLRITRRDGEWRGVYCAGAYDHERRRFLRRSCGYAGEPPARVEEADRAPASAGGGAAPARS
jgi:hypothetical protein